MRDSFALDQSVVHLNHGSFGAVPRVVAEAQSRVRDRAEANPMRFFRVDSPGLKEEARAVAGSFLGVGPDDLALLPNVTHAAATVLASLHHQDRLGPGDVIVMPEQTYQSVRRSVVHWCARTGASYVVVRHPVDATSAETVSAFEGTYAEVRDRGDRVALTVTDHVTSPTGSVLPVAGICAAARAAGSLVFVDAAHVPGQLTARPADLDADFWSGTWHKWGFAPRGATALWVADAERDGILPLTTSWNHGLDFPWPFDTAGTADYSAWYALGDAVAFWREAGGRDLGDRAAALLDQGAAAVAAALPEVDAPLPARPAPCLRMVALPAGVAATDEDADDLYGRLSAAGLEVQVTLCSGRGYLRLSAAVYNEPADYDRLADVLPGLM